MIFHSMWEGRLGVFRLRPLLLTLVFWFRNIGIFRKCFVFVPGRVWFCNKFGRTLCRCPCCTESGLQWFPCYQTRWSGCPFAPGQRFFGSLILLVFRSGFRWDRLDKHFLLLVLLRIRVLNLLLLLLLKFVFVLKRLKPLFSFFFLLFKHWFLHHSHQLIAT